MSIDPSLIQNQRGVSLVELIISMVIISVGVVAVLSTFGVSLRGSVDPMMRKQMVAIAESLLTEIQHQPFTYCDPDDANASVATSVAGCAVAANSQDVLGPVPVTETRYGNGVNAQYDNVGDYAGASSANGHLNNPIDDVTGNAAVGYTAAVTIAQVGTIYGVPQNDALQVTVTVTHGAESFALAGYRFRYAPRY
ncbi:MAG: prepilin-type N-terminal cleavage/methylation domain-containing protein [Azonexus sp.]|nr:prepilin-type N-terminal cleavage/methylation domain-containing protein [Azonexus sp.]